MRIINVVSSISSTNFGVWNAAIFGSDILKKVYNVDSELWICSRTNNDTIEPYIPFSYFKKSQLTLRGQYKWLSAYDKSDTIFVTHGAWLQPTFIGFRAKKAGFRWIYLSQGMFEPWALKNGWLKKKIYFALFEKRMSINADIIRAVSKPERNNLNKLYKRKIHLIYNGVKFNFDNLNNKSTKGLIFLFLARLHHKKGIFPLIKAWYNFMMDNTKVKLLIVGPDEGELKKISPFIKGNIEYLGSIFGEKKIELLKKANYFVLPSFSEGFPSSVVEAMSFGAIPIISEGCNFPEVFEEKLGYEVTTNEENIGEVLRKVGSLPYDLNLSRRNIEYIEKNLTEEIIGGQLYRIYSELL